MGVDVLCDVLYSNARGNVLLTGRLPELPTLPLRGGVVPLLRFIETPRVFYPGIELVADVDVSRGTDPYLADHELDGLSLFPGVMALEALAQAAVAVTGSTSPPTFENVAFHRSLVVPADEKLTLRILALVTRPDRVRLAIRCDNTGFSVDHVSAECRFDAWRGTPADLESLQAGIRSPEEAIRVDIYDSLLFHSGRFRRVGKYFSLESRSCCAEIDVDRECSWFSALRPGTLRLHDPGARDAAIHAVQACVPDSRLLPTRVERIVQGGSSASGPWRAFARETASDGTSYVYDIHVFGGDGELCESWYGLRFRDVGPIAADCWALPLLRNHLERQVRKRVCNDRLRLAVRNGADISKSARRSDALAALQTESALVFRRPDGKRTVPASETEVSVSHATDLTLAVSAPGPVACDLEPVRERSAVEWSDLLGTEYAGLAHTVASHSGEDRDAAATRIWASRECLKKSGAGFDAPLTLVGGDDSRWVTFRSGGREIATFVTCLGPAGAEMTFAVLAGGDDARV